MKKRPGFYIALVLFLAAAAGCPQPDSQQPVKRELVIKQGINQTDPQVRVLDIDPGETITVSIWDPDTGQRLPGEAVSNTASVTAAPYGQNFRITGASPGGMGIVTFKGPELDGELRVFVRNWKNSEVKRNAIYADMAKYPFSDETYDYDLTPDANGVYPPNSQAAYYLIRDAGFHYEAPDGISSRTGRKVNGDIPRTDYRPVHPVPHIIQVNDSDYLANALPSSFTLNKEVLEFIMHFEVDGDMVGGYQDRQRLEIKTMDGANDNPDMYSRGGGDTFTHRWKFRLPADFRVSAEYTHIHQVKPEGGDSGNPVFTLTARKLRTGNEVLQLIYRGPTRSNGDPSVNWYPCQVDLEPFKGEWIRAEETITYDSPGAYRLRLVRIRDMKVLMEYIYSPEQYQEFDPFVMYRPENSYIRPKFGLYRRIMHLTPFGLPNPEDPVTEFLAENNEVVVLYADFEMDKLIR